MMNGADCRTNLGSARISVNRRSPRRVVGSTVPGVVRAANMCAPEPDTTPPLAHACWDRLLPASQAAHLIKA